MAERQARSRRNLRVIDFARGAGGRDDVGIVPYEWVVGADDPVRPGPVTQNLVGLGPCALPGSGAKRNPPVTASPCQPPLGKGAEGTRDADCHNQ